jgi:biotin transport system substrate-specific component
MNTQVKIKESSSVRDITTGGMMIALFALSSNVIPPFCIISNVPITLQVLVIAMIGALLGIKNGLFCVLALLIATFCGLPFMSGFKGGPSVFLSPTGGFIFGFVLIVLIMGTYRDIILPRLIKGKYTKVIHFPAFIFVGLLAILLDYACGAIGLGLVGGKGLMDFPKLFFGVLSFLPVDILKIVTAAILTFPLYITIMSPKQFSE